MDEFGQDWDDKPVRRSVLINANVIVNAGVQNDLLMWLMSEAKGVERSLEGVARRLLFINFAGIGSTSTVSHTDIFYEPLIASGCRRLRMCYTVFFLTRNILNHCATRS